MKHPDQPTDLADAFPDDPILRRGGLADNLPRKSLTSLTLWRANRLDQEFALEATEIAAGFSQWLELHDPRLNFTAAIATYLADPSGQNATWEPRDLRRLEGALYDLARPAWTAYLDRITAPTELEP